MLTEVDRRESARTAGRAAGLLLQVVDDPLDLARITEEWGKTAGKDADQQMPTQPALPGVDGTRAAAGLDTLGPEAAPERGICEFLAVRTR